MLCIGDGGGSEIGIGEMIREMAGEGQRKEVRKG